MIRARPRWAASMVLGAIVALSPPADARRVTLRLATTVEGAPERGLDAALTASLADEEGLSVLAPDAVDSPDLLLEGTLSITPTPSTWIGIAGLQAGLHVRAVDVAGGAVLGALSREWELPPDGAPETARDRVVRSAGDRVQAWLSSEVLPRLDAAALGWEVVVHHEAPLDGDTLASIRRRLEDYGGLAVVEVRAATKTTRLRLRAEGGSLEALARALDGAEGLGLRLRGFAARTVDLERAPHRAPLVPFTRRVSAGRGVSASARRLVGEILEAKLSAVGAYAPRPARVKVSALQLATRLERRGSELWVRTSLNAPRSKRPLAAAQGVCPTRRLAGCVAALGDTLADQAVERHAEAMRAVGNAAAAPVASALPVVVDEVELDGLFPARWRAYASKPVGHVRLVPRDGERTYRSRLRVSLPGLQTGARTGAWQDASPSGVSTLPILVHPRVEALRGVVTPTPTELRIEVQVRRDGYTYREALARSLTVLGRNTIDWAEDHGATLGGFLDPEDPAVVHRAARMVAAAATSTDTLALAAAAYLSMRGLAYASDPDQPFDLRATDEVRYPSETLAGGVGDCDDLSVLFASIAHAAGARVALILLSQHVLPAVALPKSAPALDLVGAPPGTVIEHGGRRWLPVEVTAPDQPFAEAWWRGAEQVRRARQSGEAAAPVPVHQLISTYAPAQLVRVEVPPRDATVAPLDVRGAVRAARGRARQRLRRLLQEGEARAPTAHHERGVVLARLGRFEPAIRALQEAQRSTPSSAGLLGNLANTYLLADEPTDALHTYARALTSPGGDDWRLRANAIAAALVAGDAERASDLLAALDAERARAVLLRLQGSGFEKGAPAGAPDPRVARLRAFSAARLGGGGASEAKGAAREGAGLADLLFWFSTSDVRP